MPEPQGHDAVENIDRRTVEGFGKEWAEFDQSRLLGEEYDGLFEAYFGIFPFESLAGDAEGFDLGCGSGRWAAGVAPRVGRLHCIDPSTEALAVAQRRLAGAKNVEFHLASAATIPLADASQDFGYSLGVLHHIPDTQKAMADCVRKLKPGAPFLVYLYYDFDTRPGWFRLVWKGSDLVRRMVCRLPFAARKGVTNVLAALVYWPLARFSKVVERLGANPSNIPLSSYRNLSFYSMRTDSLDRFGTALEQRFSRPDIERMMRASGLSDIVFRDAEPYWVACGRRAAPPANPAR